MFVTSDIFDLEGIARWRRENWREILLGGVDVHGTHWPGNKAAARYLLEAAQRCGVAQEMWHAGYDLAGERRTRKIKPSSFDRLIRGELAGAKEATGVLLNGGRQADGTYNGGVNLGGEAGSIRQRRGPTGPIPLKGPPWGFKADFIFPLDEDPIALANDLLRLAADILGAEYGYHFVRDAYCGPEFYTHGISAPLDYMPLCDDDAEEIGDWADAGKDGRLWLGPWPLLRDLFQVNLLSDRHMAVPIGELGLLNEWIPAAPGRGRLESIGKDRWLWTLTDAEMFDVRPLLGKAGLLLSCRPRVYRDLPETNPRPIAPARPSAGSPS